MIEQERTSWHGGWSGTASPPSTAPPPEKKPRRARGTGLVVAVQSLACVAILLLALLLRAAGGEAYTHLCRRFKECLQRNDLLAAVMALWDGDPVEEVTSQVTQMNETVSGTALPDGVVAVPLMVNGFGVPPLTDGTLTSGYGYREDPFDRTVDFHRGVDIAAPTGTPIAAMYYGRVLAVGESDSLGRFVRLSHGDGVEVLYAHCSAVLVQENTVLRAGETVALVGDTGRATGSHLHVEVSADGTVFDPGGMLPMDRYA
ncbi:MAG: M23 family metallopeptidase [Ruminococcaceae bacterium]|nr:M23 family metallopeptidase [Oscillospiraceae bacterium]